MSVDVSPDGSTLVLDLLGDLYALPIGGGTATPLMTGPAFEAQPRFSPDGSEILSTPWETIRGSLRRLVPGNPAL